MLFRFVLATILLFCFAEKLQARRRSKSEKRIWLKNLTSDKYLGIQKDSSKPTLNPTIRDNTLWQIYRMGAMKCYFKNMIDNNYLSVNSDTGEILMVP